MTPSLRTGDSPRLLRRRTAAIALLVAALLTATPSDAGLTGAAGLSAAYDLVLDAQFDKVDAQTRRACPPASREACLALAAVSVWWQILINPESRQLDRQLNDAAGAAVSASEAWTVREPQRAEAWFYLAASYAPLVQWRILRAERLAAAREGKKIKDALERALALDPTLGDAYFGIGMYHYYADIAPAVAKIIRFLMFLPGGNREQGLKEMQQARDRGEVLRGEAEYQLQIVYLWYEGKTPLALDMLARLDARYPHNPIFRQSIAETRDVYLHDHAGSADAWRDLLARAIAGTVYAPRITEVRARIGLATELLTLDRVNDAIEQLKIVLDQHPAEPIGARTRAETLLRQANARRAK